MKIRHCVGLTGRRFGRSAVSSGWRPPEPNAATTAQLKIASIIDEHTRECLGGLVARAVASDILIDELDRIAVDRDYPRCCAATTYPSRSAPRWRTGLASASGWRSSHPGSPGATATSNRSTDGSRWRWRSTCLRCWRSPRGIPRSSYSQVVTQSACASWLHCWHRWCRDGGVLTMRRATASRGRRWFC